METGDGSPPPFVPDPTTELGTRCPLGRMIVCGVAKSELILLTPRSVAPMMDGAEYGRTCLVAAVVPRISGGWSAECHDARDRGE